MKNCPHYQEHRSHVESREIGSLAPRVRSYVVPWCAHTDSPVPMRKAVGVIGGNALLKCGGDLTRCQVSEHLRG